MNCKSSGIWFFCLFMWSQTDSSLWGPEHLFQDSLFCLFQKTFRLQHRIEIDRAVWSRVVQLCVPGGVPKKAAICSDILHSSCLEQVTDYSGMYPWLAVDSILSFNPASCSEPFAEQKNARRKRYCRRKEQRGVEPDKPPLLSVAILAWK